MLITGEAGVGKTRLAQELVGRHRRGVLGLSARAYPLGSTDAFGLWAEAIERHLQDLDPAEVADVCGGYLDDLAVLFHSVAAARGQAPDHDPPRLRLLEGLVRITGKLASRTPVVVVLDDVHLADASSWEALQHLVRNLDDRPLLVVATARPVELSDHPSGSEVVLGLEQEGLLTRLPITPLDLDATKVLIEKIIGEVPSPGLVQWIAERARGNPLFVGGLVRALLEEKADLTAPRLRRLPETLTERVTTRLRLLDDSARQTIELLAVVGRPVDWDELVPLAGENPEELESRLQTLLHVRLIREEEHGRELCYEVTHPLIQEAVYEAIGAGRRRHLHRLAARTLFAAGRLAEAAPHFARSAGVGDTEALAALIEALRRSEARQAHREGLVILGSLVELLPPGDDRWLEVADALSRQAAWVYRGGIEPELAVKAMRAIDATLTNDGNLARRAEVKFRLANFLAWGTGELPEAEKACAEAVDLFQQAGEQRKALLARNELSALYGLRGDCAAWRESAAEALADAEEFGDRSALTQALGNLSLAAWHQGDFDTAHPAMSRVCDLAREEGKPHRLSLSLVNYAACSFFHRTSTEAMKLIDEAKAVNPAFRESQVLQYETFFAFLAGDFGRSLRAARDVYGSPASRVGLRSAFAFAFAALSATESGLLSEAEAFLTRVPPQYWAPGFFFFGDYSHWAQGVLLARTGAGGGRAHVEEAVTQLLDKGSFYLVSFPLADVVEMAVDESDSDAMGVAVERLDVIANRVDRPVHWGLARLGSAVALAASGEHKAAADAATAAVGLLETAGCRAHVARAHHVLGSAIATVDRTAAVDALGRAATIFEACGAPWRRERSLAALRALRGPGERAAAALLGPEALSKREWQVAGLAASGRTAGEIAKQLYLSERTVEGHLAKIYAKLGIDSKLELIRRAGEFGL